MNLIQILTTPNNIINNFFTVLFTFIEVFLYSKVVTATLSIKSNFKNTIIFVLITGTIALLSDYFLKNPYSYLINIITLYLSILLILNKIIKIV